MLLAPPAVLEHFYVGQLIESGFISVSPLHTLSDVHAVIFHPCTDLLTPLYTTLQFYIHLCHYLITLLFIVAFFSCLYRPRRSQPDPLIQYNTVTLPYLFAGCCELLALHTNAVCLLGTLDSRGELVYPFSKRQLLFLKSSNV